MKRKSDLEILSYETAQTNLKKDLHSLGFKITDQASQPYRSSRHPLENIVLDLVDLKVKYHLMPLTPDDETEAMEWAENGLKALRAVIDEAIATLPTKELLQRTFETGRTSRITLLPYLAEIGEVSLFKAAFKKLHASLPIEKFVFIFDILKQSYEGSRLSEHLGLASYSLGRGDRCYIELADWILDFLHQQGKGAEFISAVLAKRDIAKEVDSHRAWSTRNNSLKEYKELKWEFRSKEFQFDEAKYKAEAERQYNEFVILPQHENLFLKSLYNYSVNPTAGNHSVNPTPEKSKISSSFLLDILASKEFKAFAFSLAVVGVAVLLGLGSGGVVPLAIGGTVLGIGLVLGAVGLFSSCSKKSSDENEQQNCSLFSVC